MKTLVLVNPASARGQTGRRWPQLQGEFRKHLGDFDLAVTDRALHAGELVRDAILRGVERIISVGGDGTNHEVLQGFFDPLTRQALNPEVGFAFVSSGTGGDFGRTLQVERRVDRQLERIVQSPGDQRIDLISCTFVDDDGPAWRVCLNAAGVGHGGDLARRVQAWKWLGGGGLPFVCAGIAGAIQISPWEVEVRVDDGPWQQRVVRNLAAFNGQFQGGGMRFAPLAALDDGQLELLFLGPLSPIVSISVGIASYAMDISDFDDVELRPSRRVELRPLPGQPPMWVELDGESPGQAPVTYEVMPGALRLAM
jgi:diacylglycerol kinase family enzyme